MDAYEATRIVFSRIQSLDPENASKIMGLLLIQDHGEKEMIRLAFGPESLLHSLVLKARNDLGISSNTPSSTPSTTPSASSSPFFSNSSSSLSRQNSSSSSSSSRMQLTNLTLPTTTTTTTSSSASSSSSSSSSASSAYSDLQTPHEDHHHHHLISPNSTSINSFNINNNNNNNNNNNGGMMMMGPSSTDLIDDFQLQDQLSFLNDPASNPTTTNSEGGMMFPSYSANWGNHPSSLNNHRRSCSVTDMCLAQDPLGSGFGWKPCLYYARGYCKNGTSCRFLHDASDPTANLMGSSGNLDVMEQCQELLLIRAKTQQQQQQQQHLRLTPTSQLLASGSLPYTSVAGKCMNFLLQQQQQQQQQNDTQRAAAAAALLLGEDLNKFRGTRMERNEFSTSSAGGGGIINPGSRQIYLTFPADSTFREEDVSNYFSIYGPVQDVRIPYQQKRMFGFVTFVYAETVKLILAKGNPHFVCDARVLVKPYKEKGKVPDKKQQQGENRGEFSPCTTPTGLDPRDPYDFQQLGGARMLYNTQDMLFRRKLEEQAELQQAIDLQSRRLMSLQLLDFKKHHHHRNLSAGAFSVPSPTHSHAFLNQTLINSMSSPDRRSPEVPEENCGSPAATAISPGADQNSQNLAVNLNPNQKDEFIGDNNDNEEKPNGDCDFHDSLEHNLPDSPFASGGDPSPFFSTTKQEAQRSIVASSASSSSPSLSSSSSNNNNVIASSLLPATSTLDMASFKSCFFPMPRFSSGHGAIEM